MSMWLLLLVGMLCGVHGILTPPDMERRFDNGQPYGGFHKSFSARYRYPVYMSKRQNDKDSKSEESSSGDSSSLPLYSKKSAEDLDWETKSKMRDSAKKRAPMPLSSISPNLPSYAHILNAGKRSPLDTFYDLPEVHHLFEVGKRSYDGVDLNSIYNLMEAGKRSYNGLMDMDHVNRMMDAGKRSYGGLDLTNLDRMMQAGKKRGYGSLDLTALDRLIQAGKRSYEGMDLDSINRLMQAGKRNYQGLDLDHISRLVQAGKKRNYGGHDLQSLDKLFRAGKRSFEDLDVQTLDRLFNAGKRTSDGVVNLDLPFLHKIYTQVSRETKRSKNNFLTRNIRPSLYDIRDMSKILEAGKKRDTDDSRTKRKANEEQGNTDESNMENEEHSHLKEKVLEADKDHDRRKRSVEWDDIFGIDRKKRGVEWSNVFGVDRKKRSWDDYFGYDKRSDLEDELIDDWLMDKYMENFNNALVLTKIDDDDDNEGGGSSSPEDDMRETVLPGYGRL